MKRLMVLFLSILFFVVVPNVYGTSDLYDKLPQKDIDLQPQREAYVQKLLNKGILHKIVWRDYKPDVVYVDVTPGKYWSLLSFEEKSGVARVIFMNYLIKTRKEPLIVFYDYYNGKRMGRFDRTWGLKIK